MFKALIVFGAVLATLCLLWKFVFYEPDTFITETMALKGSVAKGDRLFRMNCVGCHGISGQGLLGPDLHQVTSQIDDAKIINQILKGKTPPMPSFQMEPQSMADLLAYLESLN